MKTTKRKQSNSGLISKGRFTSLTAASAAVVVLAVVTAGVVLVPKIFAAAGTMSLTPASSTVSIGSNFTVTVRADSSTDQVNAVQADLTYPTNLLQFVSIDTSTSAYSVEAVNTGGSGTVSIVRGSTGAVTGNQIVAVVTFKGLAAGSAAVAFANSSALVRSSDNVNILTTKTGGTYTVSDGTAPSVPINVTNTSQGVTSIGLSWSASTDNVGVTGYRVFRNGTQVGTPTTTSFTNTGLTPNTSYTFSVAAVDAAGNVSAQSSGWTVSTLPDTSAPGAPTAILLNSRTVNSINFRWTAPTDNVSVTSYRVFRNGAQVGTPTTTSFNDTGLVPNTSYSYTVSALDAAGNVSALSTATPLSTLPDTSAPSVPGGLSSPSQSNGTVVLTWNASTDDVGVTGYRVFRDGVQIASPTGTTYTDANRPGGTYSYRVAAFDAAGNVSAQTSAVSVTVFIRGDINHDNAVNIFDLSLLLANWSTNTSSSDLNADGTVNVFDLSILLSGWTG